MTNATATRRRARVDISRLVHRDLDLAGFASQVTAVLRRAVPGEGTCLLTLDPATLLPTGEVVHNGLPPDAMPRLAEIEQREPDFNKITALAAPILAGRQPERRHRRPPRGQRAAARATAAERLRR